MYKFDYDFFKKIDSQEKAYVLGFFFADGYNSGTQVSFTQTIQDEDILIKINKVMNSEVPIYKYSKKIGQDIKVLNFSSREMCQDLNNLGGIKNKSLFLEFPDYLPKELIPHFIRGYFDGDGCIWNGKRKKMVVKDSSRKEGFRERIVHNVKFTFTGYNKFIESIQNYLLESGVVKKKTKLNYSKAKDPKNNTCYKVCTMEYSGRGQIKKLFELLYTNATIYGNRKYNKFKEILCATEEKSSDETELIAENSEMKISSQVTSNIEDKGSSTIPEMEVESSDSKNSALNE